MQRVSTEVWLKTIRALPTIPKAKEVTQNVVEFALAETIVGVVVHCTQTGEFIRYMDDGLLRDPASQISLYPRAQRPNLAVVSDAA